jgi:ketosteroid isomerase-like protein
MSQENVEIVRQAYEAFNRGGPTAVLPFLDPQVEWHDIADQPDAVVHHGHQGVLEAFDRWLSAFDEDYKNEIEEAIDRGHEVVVFDRQHGRGAESGVDFHQKLASVWTVRGGSIVRVRFFSKREEALEAVGLSE